MHWGYCSLVQSHQNDVDVGYRMLKIPFIAPKMMCILFVGWRQGVFSEAFGSDETEKKYILSIEMNIKFSTAEAGLLH